MKRTVEGALALAAVILTVAFLSAVSGGGAFFGKSSREPRDGRYFHAGKLPPVSGEDRPCRSPECHAGMPHVRDRTLAAFRNMHLRFVDCLVCHGRDSRKSWSAEPPPPEPKQATGDTGPVRKRWKIASPMPGIEREKAHATLGAALSCRACHSEEGYRNITARGVKDLPAGFVNPVALRMIEEGAKQWIPDTMR